MSDLDDILRALNIVYSPQTSNEDRKSATVLLEETKRTPQALSVGITLAQDRLRPPTVRYYGLSLLEHGVRYLWDSFTREESIQIRSWILDLAHEINGGEPQFIRNKIAQLLEETAEFSWGVDWIDFDQQLCRLWDGPLAHKEVVLYVLQTLSEKVFGKDEVSVGPRGAELGKYCVEIFVPCTDHINGSDSASIRYGKDGWLHRITTLLRNCLQSNDITQPGLVDCLVKSLSVLRSCFSWITFEAVGKTECVLALCKCLRVEEPQVQLLSLEALHALYHRGGFQKHDVEILVGPFLSYDGLSLLHGLYDKLSASHEDIDDPQYACLKKLAEVICSLGLFIETLPWMLERQDLCDYHTFIDLLIYTLRDPSLAVTIPIIFLWTKLAAAKHVRDSTDFARVIGVLLQICSERLLRYEMLPIDQGNKTLQLLIDDFDTIPERHAFVGNYRRFCMSVIERIVRKSPFEAMSHILTQSESVLRRLERQTPAESRSGFTTDSTEQLSVEAQFVVVNTATKSYVRWLQGRTASADEQQLQDRKALESSCHEWCLTVLNNGTQDPIIQKRVLLTVVELATTVISSSSQVALAICKHVLSQPIAVNLGSDPFDEAMKDYQNSQARELQRLAVRSPDDLYTVYSDLQNTVNNRLSDPKVERRLRLDYQAFLLTIIHHSTIPTDVERDAKVSEMMDPLIQSWQDGRFETANTDLQSFLQLLGLNEYPNYFLSRNAHGIDDWSGTMLDEEGIRIRDEVHHRIEQLPLQATRALLTVYSSTPRPQNSNAVDAKNPSVELLPIVLPRVLPLLRMAHGFSNPDKWLAYPPEMKSILGRTIQDRVWQNGISNESRDAFFARVRDSKASLEGLASAVRGAVRSVRELTMWILHSFCQLGESLYSHHDLPQPLAAALFEDSTCLPPHQFSALLSLSSTIIDHCPAQHRDFFLAPLLIPLFTQLDTKLGTEWQRLAHRTNGDVGADNLEQEMKNESVVRNLTHSAVLLTSNLLSFSPKAPKAGAPQTDNNGNSSDVKPIRASILTSSQILEPLMLLCTHTLRMRDGRSCAMISRVLRSLVPEFQHTEADGMPSPGSQAVMIDASTSAVVREFFSTEILKACITSINEPYYADLQKDLAALVAAIIAAYSPRTDTPRAVLSSLPGMSERKLSSHIDQICRSTSERQQRACVLSLLDTVRGVSIHEQGKMEKPARKSRSAMQEQYVAAATTDNGVGIGTGANNGIIRGGTPDGVADLFG